MTRTSCPASISFIFKNCHHNNLIKKGSIGVGCTIDKKVIVETEKSDLNKIIFNNTSINFPTVSSVVKKLALTPIMVSIKSYLPLGYGFGISGASSLACAYALNYLFNLKKSSLELNQIAHVAEIINKTGLGSVTTQITGGFLIKNKPGIPVGTISLPFIGRKLYAVIIDRLETPTVLYDKKRLQKINQSADLALDQIKSTKDITLEEIFDISYIFSKESGLLNNKRLDSVINKIQRNGGHATMSMLGHVVISDRIPNMSMGYPVEELTIIKDSVRLTDD